MLVLFLFVNAWGRSDSAYNKNIEKKSQTANIFISEGTSVYGKGIIYNAKFSVIKKKRFKTDTKFSAQKKITPSETKQKRSIVKKNYYENITINSESNKELQDATNQKAEYIRLLEHYTSNLAVLYKTGTRLYFVKKLLPSIYNHIPIENGKNMTLSIRPPPKNHFQSMHKRRV